MNEEYTNIWELYGLKTNPFFTEPLLLFGGDIDLRVGFVGREEEVKRLRSIFGSGGSRIIVYGDVGVGKTTLVNYVRAIMPSNTFFTPLKEIAVQSEWNGGDFILNTLASIYYTIKRRSDLSKTFLSSELIKKLELLIDIVERKDRNISLNIGVVGGGVGSTTTINLPNLTIHSLQIFFEQIVEEIKKAGFKEIILHYNNLDIFETQNLQKIFNSIRDFIQTKDVNFIFIGDLAVPQVINQMKRVSSIMSDSSIFIENLSLNNLKKLLDTRINHLSASGLVPVKPYEDEVISKLYTLYDGNLRFVLNSLSTAFNEMVVDTPLILNSELLMRVLSETSRKRWLNKLTDLERDVLFFILDEGETTNKKIATNLIKQKQNISKITNKLLQLNAIKIKKMEGKEKFFSVVHSIKWILLDRDLKPNKKQKEQPMGIEKEIQQVLKF